jgi:hypothetical protein
MGKNLGRMRLVAILGGLFWGVFPAHAGVFTGEIY